MIWACGYGIIPVIIFGFAGYENILLKECCRMFRQPWCECKRGVIGKENSSSIDHDLY